MRLDLTADPIDLTAALIDIPSVSGDEDVLVTAVTEALGRQAPTMELLRTGNVVMARTVLGRPTRVLLAGHLDTVPIADNVPSRREGDVLHGCGTSDMKSGDAMILHVAATVENPTHDITVIMYDCEEIERERNGLTRIERDHRDWLEADLAILAEPTNGQVEAGCQGTMRAVLRTKGVRSHAARSWLGDNAIHHAGAVLRVLEDYQPRTVDIDGCVYREGLNAVGVTGGVAGNVIPDECVVEINFRFAPDRSVAQAQDHIREVFPDIDIEFTDAAPGALPGLSAPATQAFMATTGTTAIAKYGWTDVSRFAALGIPALNYGPGDPNLAHKRDEHVMTPKITDCANTLRRYLTTPV